MSLSGNKTKQKTSGSQTMNQTATNTLSDRASGLLTGQIDRLSGQQYQAFDPASIERFQNHYQEQVIDASLADMNQQRGVAGNELKAGLAKSGAFGDNRRGILEAELAGQFDRNTGSLVSGLRSQGFSQAQAAAQQDNQSRNQYDLMIQQLIAQLTGQFGREGTQVSNGSGTSSGSSSGSSFGFDWAPKMPGM